MSRPTDPEGDARRARFLALLERAAEGGGKLSFWWRDDDAEDVTPGLERLLDLSRRFDLPLALAVVPASATEALAARIAGEPRVAVLQHGFRHLRHNPEGEKKAEFGDHRPAAAMQRELAAGRERLEKLFPNFWPVLVPPWNRIGEAGDAARRAAGLTGLSLYGPKRRADPHLVNTHLDIFDWKGTRGPMARPQAYAILCDETERRLGGEAEPIGVLSHHLIHQEASWALLEELFAAIRYHPAVDWLPIAEVFRLTERTPHERPSKPAKPAKKAAAKLVAENATNSRNRAGKLQSGKAGEPVLLSGGNPQIAKGHSDAPVQAYIAAMPGWKSAVGRRLDALIERTVPGVQKAVKWNSPFYGAEGQGWFLSFHCFAKYVKVAFFRGASLSPVPPVGSKHKEVRYFHIHEHDQLDEALLAAWVNQASQLPGEKM